MSENAEFEHIRGFNRAVFGLDDTHPAKVFLDAFIECRWNCVGRELGEDEAPIDQEWTSATDGRRWTFSAFAYKVLSFDIELDGFTTNAPRLTSSEEFAIEQLPHYHALMEECAHAAEKCRNTECLELVREVERMLELWSKYLIYRKELISDTRR